MKIIIKLKPSTIEKRVVSLHVDYQLGECDTPNVCRYGLQIYDALVSGMNGGKATRDKHDFNVLPNEEGEAQ